MSTSLKRLTRTAAFVAFTVTISTVAPAATATEEGSARLTVAASNNRASGTHLPLDRDAPGSEGFDGGSSNTGSGGSSSKNPGASSSREVDSGGPAGGANGSRDAGRNGSPAEENDGDNTGNSAENQSEGAPNTQSSNEPTAAATPNNNVAPQTGSNFEIDGNGKLVRYKGSAKDVRIPETVKVIGRRAFDRTGILKVTIPATVTEIEDEGFVGCSSLTSVEFEDTAAKPSHLTKLGKKAFYYTSSLKEVTLPRSVTTLSPQVFSKSGLMKVSLPAGVTEIPSEAFFRAGKLKDVTIADGVTRFEYRAFARTRVDNFKLVGADGRSAGTGFPSKLKFIGDFAFWQSALKEVVLSSEAESIGRSAFSNVPLTKVTLKEGLKTIGSGAFARTRLTELTIPDSVTDATDSVRAMGKLVKLHIGKNVGPDQLNGAFFGTASLTKISVAQGNPNYTIVGNVLFNGQRTKLLLIPRRHLDDGAGIKKYRIPAGVQEITGYAFEGTEYEEVDFPSSLRSIGTYAFSSSHLKEAILPSGLETIGEGAFRESSGLTRVDLGGTVTIDKAAFSKTLTLKNVNMHTDLNRLKEIRSYAFEGSALTEVRMPDSLTAIGEFAFLNDEELAKVRLGAGLRTLDDGTVFYNALKLRELTVAEGNPVFSADHNVLYAKRGDGLHVVFSSPASIATNYRVKDGTVVIDSSAFANNSKLETVFLPDGLKRISDRSFENATALKDVRFPDSLETVDGFANTSLRKVDLGTKITSIETAFNEKSPERIIVRGGNNGKFSDSFDNDAKPVSAYFGEGMTAVNYSRALFPKVLVLPSSLKEFNIDSAGDNDAWKASAVFYVAADRGSSAWKLASEKMKAIGMDPSKQLKRYVPMSAKASGRVSSEGNGSAKVDIRGGVTQGAHQARVVSVASDGTTKALSDWVEAKATGDHYEANINYAASGQGGQIKVEVRDHTELTLLTEITIG